MDRPDRNPSSAQKHAHVDWSAYPLGPHQVAAMRRPRTEASTRRLDNAKGLTIRGPLQKDGLSVSETHREHRVEGLLMGFAELPSYDCRAREKQHGLRSRSVHRRLPRESHA